MLIPIVCLTCGCPLGDREDLFRELRAERVQEVLGPRGTVPTQAAVDTGLQIDCSDILEKLGIENDCCRAHMVTGMVYEDYY